MIKRLSIILLVLCVYSPIVHAYFEGYPPYRFKDKPPKHLEIDTLVDYDKPEYKSPDGKIYVHLDDAGDFTIKDGKTNVVSIKERGEYNPQVVWWVDLDGNGLKDFIVFNWFGGCGLAFYDYRADIYLKKQEGIYQKISYQTQAPDLEDFVDMNKDGKYEVIITDIRAVEGHTYFTYNIYEFKDYKLVNADAKVKGFPKFIWYTYKDNDKDTTRLSKEEKFSLTKEKNESIKYMELR